MHAPEPRRSSDDIARLLVMVDHYMCKVQPLRDQYIGPRGGGERLPFNRALCSATWRRAHQRHRCGVDNTIQVMYGLSMTNISVEWRLWTGMKARGLPVIADVDVAVVGAGAAGVASATVAAEAGASVLIVEK